MLIAGVLCLVAGVLAAVAAIRNQRVRSGHEAPIRQALAPTQFAGAGLLVVGGIAALARPESTLLVLIGCVVGALATIAAGSWRAARIAVTEPQSAGGGGCGSAGGCGGCGQICGS